MNENNEREREGKKRMNSLIWMTHNFHWSQLRKKNNPNKLPRAHHISSKTFLAIKKQLGLQINIQIQKRHPLLTSKTITNSTTYSLFVWWQFLYKHLDKLIRVLGTFWSCLSSHYLMSTCIDNFPFFFLYTDRPDIHIEKYNNWSKF